MSKKERILYRLFSSSILTLQLVLLFVYLQVAADTRDSLAMCLFVKLFQLIITRINENNSAEGGSAVSDRKIGLLDIFGFEIFESNSLEQLCINYCNEMLQNHFNYVIFTAEKELYAMEGVHCDTIEFKDNLPVISEIQNLFKVGISRKLKKCIELVADLVLASKQHV